MTRRICGLATSAALAACLGVFAGTALADNGKNPPGSPPGNSENAPGQQKKEEPAPPPAPAPAEQPAATLTAAQPAPAAPGHNKEKPAKAASAGRGQGHTPEPVQAQPAASASAQPSSRGRSEEAHHHVIVCHRTGSDSNPYVVINIPLTAWHGGHTSHPARDGRSDILLKDPASRPGSKDGFTKEDCEARAGLSGAAPSAAATANAPTSTTAVTTTAAVTAAAPAPATSAVTSPAAAGPPAAAAGVLGASASASPPSGRAAAGVLGATGRLGQSAVRGTLPFTGLPLWAAALAGFGLIALGVLLHRRPRRAQN